MDREELQALQTPLKERYREEPEAALITRRAEGLLDGANIACSVATGRALVEAGLHAATGGTGMLACSDDFRGTLAVDRETPVGFTAIRLFFELESDASQEQLDTLLRLTERYCVVLQTLTGGVPVDVSY